MAIGLSGAASGAACGFGSPLQLARRIQSIDTVKILIGYVLLTKIEASHEVQRLFTGNYFVVGFL
jgi:hypothetical protein